MPKAELPHSWAGWLVALASSFAGFIAGFLVIAMLNKMMGEG
jgi:hypothetical protein